jgi:hypothetical protein
VKRSISSWTDHNNKKKRMTIAPNKKRLIVGGSRWTRKKRMQNIYDDEDLRRKSCKHYSRMQHTQSSK